MTNERFNEIKDSCEVTFTGQRLAECIAEIERLRRVVAERDAMIRDAVDTVSDWMVPEDDREYWLARANEILNDTTARAVSDPAEPGKEGAK